MSHVSDSDTTDSDTMSDSLELPQHMVRFRLYSAA